jgi:light-regulated signal transduction histidine kinase (bacteriophytochrome)
MAADEATKLKDQSLIFLGKIMASISHELNNTVAIIKEYNGLLEDSLLDTQRGNPIDDKKVERVTKKIASQTEKGTEIIKRFNRFAHSLDYPVNEIVVKELLEAIIALSRRLTEMKGIYLKLDSVDETLAFKTSPLLFQQAVFLCFEIFMADPENNSQMILSADKNDKNVIVEISGNKITDDDLIISQKQTLEMVMKHLNGTFEKKIGAKDRQLIVLTMQDLDSNQS